MNVFYKFPSIGQFRNIVKDVWHFDPAAKLTFTGTVKVHGTNAAIVVHPDGSYHCQSRSRIITVDDDNLGFAAWVRDSGVDLSQFVRVGCDVVLFGEFAGRGIQRRVAVNAVDRFFYLFEAAMGHGDGTVNWLPEIYQGAGVNSGEVFRVSEDFGLAEIDIDFAHPEASQNKLVELTEAVEAQCLVGHALGIEGVGEGIVWRHLTDDGQLLMFKVKGEKHSVSKVKKLAQVDPEKVASVQKFLEYAVTEQRLQQGLAEVCGGDADRKYLSAFLKWVSTDVVKEESDVLEASGLTMKDVGNPMSIRGREWFFSKEIL